VTPPLSSVPREKRADFLADLYLVLRQRNKDRAADPVKEPFVEDPFLAPLADAAAAAAKDWDSIVSCETTHDAQAARLIAAVDKALRREEGLLSQGAIDDWMSRAGETLRRAAFWPGDAVSSVFAELRPTLNEFIAYFLGDIFAYLNERESSGMVGKIPQRVMAALARAHARKRATGEKIIVITHSMGGQLLYDVLTFYAPANQVLDGLEIDHWISCGSQVSLFAELRLFRGQPDIRSPQKLARPSCVEAWTNFFDRNDLVGFVMEPVFDGATDVEYDTGYGLAFAHTGFLARPSFFEAIADRL
jgi:hypothetical protein